MDPVSAAASIAGIIQLSSQVISYCVDYFQKVKSARSDITRLQTELVAFQTVAQQLRELLQTPKAAKLPNSAAVHRDIHEQCNKELQDVLEKLEPSGMRRVGIRALKWPFDSSAVERTIDKFQRYRSIFSTALEIDQTVVITNIDDKIDKAEEDRLLSKLDPASGASYNAIEQKNARYCLASTRVEILNEISAWSRDAEQQHIYWIYGVAGSGKSTIARTAARTADTTQAIVSSFFFSRQRGGDLLTGTKFFRTIAYQLAAKSTIFRRAVCDRITSQSDANLGLQEQWSQFVLQPLQLLAEETKQKTLVILVVDALDECEDEEDLRTILQVFSAAPSIPNLQLRVLLTSRPEIPIRLKFEQMPNTVHKDLALHNVRPESTRDDIALFVRHELTHVRERFQLDPNWPGEDKISIIAQKADRLFIYASTVCKFVGESWLISPEERLDNVLKYGSSDRSATQTLDVLYAQILNLLPMSSLTSDEAKNFGERFQLFAGSIVTLMEPLPIESLAKFHAQGDEHQEHPTLSAIKRTLGPLHSVFYYSSNQPIHILHPSFADFLKDKQRCQQTAFWIDESSAHLEAFENCMKVMEKYLKKNICSLQTPGIRQNEIGSSNIQRNIPTHVQYSCKYWISHFQRSSSQDFQRVLEFFTQKALFWLEALSITGQLVDTVIGLLALESLCEKRNMSVLRQHVYDLRRFLLTNKEEIETAPLQIYASALVFAPQSSLVRQNYFHLSPSWFDAPPPVNESWDLCLHTLSQPGDFIAFAISPDGKVLCSLSAPDMIRMWDVASGALLKAIKWKSGLIGPLRFSSDGKLIAIISDDKTASLLHASTGAVKWTLDDYEDVGGEVLLLPYTDLIVSTSKDFAIKLWNVATGELSKTLEGHTQPILYMANSLDGRILASASFDGTVKFWNVAQGLLQGSIILNDFFEDSDQLAFDLSADGALLAVSGDEISILDTTKGTLLHTLQNQTVIRADITFSPTSNQLVSVTSNLELWDAKTGVLTATLIGHTHEVWSAIFSHDGTLIASVSNDWTVRIWDARSCTVKHTLEGHTRGFHGAAFSPKDDLIVTMSWDEEVKIWSVPMESQPRRLQSPSSQISAVGLSRDGKLAASAFLDGTIGVWEMATGSLQHTLNGKASLSGRLFLSPDAALLAKSLADSGIVELWTTDTGHLLRTFEAPGTGLRRVDFSLDGRQLAIFKRGRIQLYDTTDKRVTLTFDRATNVVAVKISPDGKLLAISWNTPTIELWRIKEATLATILEEHSGLNEVLAFSPKSTFLVSAIYGGEIKLWDLTTYLLLATLDTKSQVLALVVSPHNETIVALMEDSSVQIWEPVSASMVRSFSTNDFFVDIGFGFSQDGSRLLPWNLHTPAECRGSDSHAENDESAIALEEGGWWVCWRGQPIFLIPRSLRSVFFGGHGNSFFSANRNGRITFFSFKDMRELEF